MLYVYSTILCTLMNGSADMDIRNILAFNLDFVMWIAFFLINRHTQTYQ